MNERGWTCGIGNDTYVQAGETWSKETNWKTYTYMGG